ncbi:MAG: DUF4236 domain-containing protein [Oscillospiraceae bacterium]|nr:DUF4236 domain-containing protein [Oscillospiraceae bacterium]
MSKSGIGYSIGGKGFRVTQKANGGTRTTASIPGTGISSVNDSSSDSVDRSTKTTDSKTCLGGCSIIFCPLLIFIVIVSLKSGKPAGLFSISCLSYNKRSNWLAMFSLGFHVCRTDCQPSSCCSVRFKQVEPLCSCHPID